MKEGVKMLLMYDDNVSEINLPYKLAQITSIKVNGNFGNAKLLYLTSTSVFNKQIFRAQPDHDLVHRHEVCVV